MRNLVTRVIHSIMGTSFDVAERVVSVIMGAAFNSTEWVLRRIFN